MYSNHNHQQLLQHHINNNNNNNDNDNDNDNDNSNSNNNNNNRFVKDSKKATQLFGESLFRLNASTWLHPGGVKSLRPNVKEAKIRRFGDHVSRKNMMEKVVILIVWVSPNFIGIAFLTSKVAEEVLKAPN